MRVALASDIHLEIPNQRPMTLLEDVDVIVFAGDIHKSHKAITWASRFLRGDIEIVMVAGNHEHWKGEYHKTLDTMREEARKYPGLHFLENNRVDIKGWTFLGSTAWTDFSYGPHSMYLNQQEAQGAMNDYKQIKWFTGSTWRKLLPRDIVVENSHAKQFIFNNIENRKNTIVVTHHAPCELSISEQHKYDPLNHSYANQWGNDVVDKGPAFWFHGHMHDPVDYWLGDTRVICNPIGYPGQYADTTFKIFDV